MVKDAIRAHDLSWKLLRCSDQLMRHLIGIYLTVLVPLFVVVVSNFEMLYISFSSAWTMIASLVVSVTAIAMIACSGAYVNVEVRPEYTHITIIYLCPPSPHSKLGQTDARFPLAGPRSQRDFGTNDAA